MLQAPRAADPIHREAVKKGPRGKRSVRPAQKPSTARASSIKSAVISLLKEKLERL